MTPKQADAAIVAARPITVSTPCGEKFQITIKSRSERTVRAVYEYEGKARAGAFRSPR